MGKASTAPSIVKEYFNSQIDMRGPGNPKAAPAITGTTCILRFADNQVLTTKNIAPLFNELTKDFGERALKDITVNFDRVEFRAQPTPAYKALSPRIIGARG